MTRRTDRHLAQLNVGRLVVPTGDPRVAEFMAALDRVDGLGRRMPGFVWMMEGSGAPGTGNTEAKVGGDPQAIVNLTVWEGAAELERFVWDTVHARLSERRHEWFEVMGAMHLVTWWVPAGHRRSPDEVLDRLDHLRAHGDGDRAFGWAHLSEASRWRERGCAGRPEAA